LSESFCVPESPWRTPAAKEVGIVDHCGWHTFRHTYATLLKSNGEDLKVVQELMRHANISVTLNIYAQAISQSKRAQSWL
jgi:site-specific recombinase XerD